MSPRGSVYFSSSNTHPPATMTKPRAILAVRLCDGTQLFANDESAARLLIDHFGKACTLRGLPGASDAFPVVGSGAIIDATTVDSVHASHLNAERYEISSDAHSEAETTHCRISEISEKLDIVSAKLELATAGLIAIANRELKVLEGDSFAPQLGGNVTSKDCSYRAEEAFAGTASLHGGDTPNHNVGTPYADWYIGDIRSDIASQTECNLADAGCQSVVSGDIFDLTTVESHTNAHEKELLSQVELLKDKFGKMAVCKEQSLSEALEMISQLTSKIEKLEGKPCQPKVKARKCR